MLIGRFCFVAAVPISLIAARSATPALVDYNFSISYSGSSITGRLVGLNLDASGNGSEVDPSSVLLFTVPASVGLAASPSHPYVFVPHTFERSTFFSGTLTSTTPGVYGFQVSNYTMNPPAQNLLMIDTGNDVTLVFNFGASLGGEGGVATYGIQAEEDALWPAINSFVSFAAVSVPGDYNHNGIVDAADYTVWRDTLGQSGAGLAADGNGDGMIDSGDYDVWNANYGNHPGSGAAANSTAPEPATRPMLLVGILTFCASRRQTCRKLMWP